MEEGAGKKEGFVWSEIFLGRQKGAFGLLL